MTLLHSWSLMLNETAITVMHKRVKNINLRIDRQGTVSISAPMHCPKKRIIEFLKEKAGWIKRHKERIDAHQKQDDLIRNSPHSFYLGIPYVLKMCETHEKPRVFLDKNHLICFVKTSSTEEDKEKLLRSWHQQQMKYLLPDLIHKWEKIIGVRVATWGIKAMKSRWGSCNTVKKRIWLNLHLIHKPLICLEYVLVHELVHLLEASHNARFYALMDQFMPNWRDHRNVLKRPLPLEV